MTSLSISAPAYNEEACIRPVVRSWLAVLDEMQVDGEIVVADDGSTDRTGSILQELTAEDDRVRHVSLAENSGYGAAMRAAIAAASGQYVLTIDADGQFDPDDIPRLWRLRDPRTLVKGARTSKADTAARVLGNRVLARVARRLLDFPGRDPQCALNLVPRQWIAQAGLSADGIGFPTELVARAHWDGLHIEEVAVNHLDRMGGESKLHLLRTSVSTLIFLARLRWRRP